MSNSTALIGAAGVHHVVSELCRRGMVALPTVRNTAAYDVVVINAAGTRHANVQVKTSGKRTNGFPMPEAERVRTGRHDWYVFVRWLEREQRWECFLLTGRVARAEVERTTRRKRAARGEDSVIIHSVDVGPGTGAASWRRAWERWRL